MKTGSLARWRTVAALSVLLVMLLLFGGALAEKAMLAETARTDYTVLAKDGLKFTEDGEPKYENGVWRMTIDTAATDWDYVVAAGYTESREIHGVELKIFADSGKRALLGVTQSHSGTQKMLEEWLQDAVDQQPFLPMGQYSQYCYMGVKIGYYDAQAGKFFPQEIKPEDHRAILARFKYQDNTYDSRYALVEVSFDSTDPVNVNLPVAKAEDVIPNFGGTSLEVSVKDGSVEYNNPSDNPQAMELVTAVKAPGTKEETQGWIALDGYRELELAQTADGHRVACIEEDIPGWVCVETSEKVIIWQDAQKNIRGYQRIALKTVQGNPVPWPEYLDDLQPLQVGNPADVQLDILGGVDGVRKEVSGYTVRLAFDENVLLAAAAQGQNLAEAELGVKIKAPQGAAWFTGAKSILGGKNIYGSELADYYQRNGWLEPSLEDALPVVGEWVDVGGVSYFEKKSYPNPAGGTMNYYLVDNRNLATEMGGGVQIISWFDSNMDLICQNYLVFCYDNISMVSQEAVLEDESELDETVKDPRVVIKGNWHKGHGQVELHAERLLSSPNTHYYNLQLVGEDGAVIPVPAGEKCDVYLPYPEGYNREKAQAEGLEITIGHYNEQMVLAEEAFSVAKGNLELTPFGMRLRVSGFSPYVVSWQKAESAPLPTETPAEAEVPKTGDAFPLSTVLMLALLAVLGMMLLGGKKRCA